MSIIGSDNRQVITSFGTFPYSTVAAVDGYSVFGDKYRNYYGTGIVIAPNHVLTAGHNAYDPEYNQKVQILRTTISANLSKLTLFCHSKSSRIEEKA